jgi:hypothetical protein
MGFWMSSSLKSNTPTVLGFIQVWANWLQPATLVFIRDLRKFDEGFAFNYNLNWLCLGFGIWSARARAEEMSIKAAKV